VLPANAPPLGATIETDLAEHGFALLRGAMALRSQAGASELTGKAFERAANAFEALVRNGDPESPDRGFRRTIAAAAYHLAGFRPSPIRSSTRRRKTSTLRRRRRSGT
jgi:hypothetical protein